MGKACGRLGRGRGRGGGQRIPRSLMLRGPPISQKPWHSKKATDSGPVGGLGGGAEANEFSDMFDVRGV